MQGTLFKFGFTKKIISERGTCYDVTQSMPKTASSILKPIECDVCKENFTSKQYLGTHMFWKHPAPSRSHDRQHEMEIITTGHDEGKPAAKSMAVVLTDSETEVAEEVTEEESRGRSSVRRGSCKRRSYTLDFKVKTLRLLDRLSVTKNMKNKWEKVASMRGISSKSLVVKWNKDRKKLLGCLSNNTIKEGAGNFKAARQRRKVPSKEKEQEKLPLASKAVVAEFKQRRKKGLKITKLWFCKTMKRRIQDIYGIEKANNFKASNNWFHRFKKRYQISLRNRTNKKQKSADDCRSTIQSFHRTLRRALKTQRQRLHGKTAIDTKWGRWLPANRYNVDQVPLPFVVDQGKTYAETGDKQIWISQPISGLKKRQATLQLCIRAKGEQTIKPAIIFEEKVMCHCKNLPNMTNVLMYISRKMHGWTMKSTLNGQKIL